ncbi:MAG: amidase [Hyphomicrobiales bacterium]
MQDLTDLTASEAAGRLARGELSAVDMVDACLDRVAAADGAIEAWAHLDAGFAREQATEADAFRRAGHPTGPLHGVPVGVKDIIDTRALPTENGTPLDAGRRPTADATVVARLHQAGAVVLGKTVTTELAYFSPGKTRNPHDRERTPGGSSSGSAAAVAAHMVPFAIGTQTNGSVIRPAAFCGTVGFKPSHGLIPRHGILQQSPHLDTVGVFARTVEDAALLADALVGFDPADPATCPAAHPRLGDIAGAEPPVTPSFALVRQPVWDQAEAATREAFSELKGFLGDACDDVELPAPFDRGHAIHRTIMTADFAKNLGRYYDAGEAQLSAQIRQAIEEGRTVLAADYNIALEWIEILNAGLDELFERYDAILTPAAPGEAPMGLDATGNPAFCTLWTLCGTPAVTLPLLQGENGLPVGVQLVAPRGDDGRLLRTARWLMKRVLEADD